MKTKQKANNSIAFEEYMRTCYPTWNRLESLSKREKRWGRVEK